jgi:transcriptional regulator with XRE-family HTH domain
MSFSANLKRLRLEAQLTQLELAERADVSANQLQKYESGVQQKPRAITLARLSQALGCNPEELTGNFLEVRGREAKRLPPIIEVESCPHCGHDEFAVKQTYQGSGLYYRRLDGKEGADNTEMYNCLNHKVGKIAYCGMCEEPIGRWDETEHSKNYHKFNPDLRRGGV